MLKYCSFPLLFALFCSLPGTYAQSSVTDEELASITDELILRLKAKKFEDNLIVYDFTDVDGTPTELGAFLAESVSGRLVNAIAAFSVIDRNKVMENPRRNNFIKGLTKTLQSVSEETLGYQEQQYVEDASSALNDFVVFQPRDKRLKNVDLIVYGTLTTVGDHYRLHLKARTKKKDILLATCEGDLTNTQALARLHGATLTPPTAANSSLTLAGAAANQSIANPDHQFEKQHLNFDLIECRTSGSAIEIKLRINSLNKDDVLFFQKNNTVIVNSEGGSEFAPHSLNIGDQTQDWRVTKQLVRNTAVESILTFYPGEDVSVIKKLGINAHSEAFGWFYIEMFDIFVE